MDRRENRTMKCNVRNTITQQNNQAEAEYRNHRSVIDTLPKLSLLAACMLSTSVQAEETKSTLETVTVKATPVQNSSSIGTREVVSKEEIQTFFNRTMINPYEAISLEPGVDIRFNDPTGTNITYKIRGNSSRGYGLILEGLPIKGIGIGQPMGNMVDMENIDNITVDKGATAADGRFGFGSLVDMNITRPKDRFSSNIKQTIGSDSLSKTYIRFDTGNIGGISAFFSGSVTDADKFKGSGKAVDRKNFSFGITGGLPGGIEWEVFGIYNDQKRDLYKGLTYEQSTSLSNNRNLDYNPVKTGNAADDISYYAYNREDYRVSTILGKLRIPFGQNSSLTFRPYFLNDKGHAYSGSRSTMVNYQPQNNVIVESLVDHDTFGAVLEYEKQWQNSHLRIGYWHGEHEPPGPPTARKVRDTNLNFIGWANLYGVGKRHTFDVPYVGYQHIFDRTIIETGLKHLRLATAKYISYNTAGIGDVSHSQARAQASKVDFTLPSNDYTIWLPNIGVTHYLDDTSLISASYGKNYDMPEIGFANGAINYFKNLGYDEEKIQNMWAKRIRPEESNDFDLGYSYSSERLSFASVLYYKKMKYLSTSYYDAALDLTYSQNAGSGRAYGLELSSGYRASNNLSINLALTYGRSSFTEDIPSLTGTIGTKGKQLPDRPKLYGNLSAIYDLNGFKIAPVVRYLGQRYADVLNQYSAGSTWLADLSIGKDITLGDGHKLQFSLSAMNIFDKKYISTISTSDTNTTQTGPTYIVGAPRSVFASLQYRY